MISFIATILLPFSLLGLFTVYHWVKSAKPPVDASNVINSIRLWWFALTRRELFVDIFPWLKNDELENVKRD